MLSFTTSWRAIILALACASALVAGCSFEPPNTPVGQDAADMRADEDLTGADGVTPLDMRLDEDLRPPAEDMPTDAAPPRDMRDASMQPDLEDMRQMAPNMPEMDMGPDEILRICDGDRIDVANDPNNCGQCGVTCDAEFGVCANARCGCLGGVMEACGAERRCVDTRYDANNCGQCGFACSAGAECVMGQCVCREGLTSCGGTCVDTDSDPRHCGSCGTTCDGERCRGGSCTGDLLCGLGYTDCGDVPGGTACISNQDDNNPLHCRNFANALCGDVCAADEVCRKPDTFVRRECYNRRIGRGCMACPCADCGGEDRCEVIEGSMPPAVWCIEQR